jgi:peptide/nickel transport system substrate-binding protein
VEQIRTRGWVAVAVTMALLIGACSAATPSASPAITQGSSPAPVDGSPVADRTIIVGWSQETQGCDYTTLVTIGGGMLTCPEYNQETLVRYDVNAETVLPALATSWTEQPDSITFNLRSGVTFHDGTPFDADAVVFNFRRAFDTTFPANQGLTIPYKSYVPVYKGVTKVDDMTVRVDINPGPNALRMFSTPATYIQSPTAVQAEGADYPLNPVGTGPYKVVSFVPNQRFELVRNEAYWGDRLAPDRIIGIIKTDTASLVNDLLGGTIDAMVSPPAAQQAQLEAAGLEVEFFPTIQINYMALNVTMAPFDDVLVRQAANYALDREAIVQVLNGSVSAQPAAWFSDVYGYNQDATVYNFDPAKASQLLDQAGWTLPAGGNVRQKDGQELAVTLVMRQGQAGGQGAQPTVAVSNLQDVGFKVDLQVRDAASYNSETAGVFSPTCCNMANAGFAATFPDPIDWLARWTTAAIPPGERNFAFYSNPAYDALVESARVEIDESKRLQTIKDAFLILANEAPMVFSTREQGTVAWNPNKIVSLELTKSFSRVDPWSIMLK